MTAPPPPGYYDTRVEATLDRPFAVAGRRCYLIGHMDGGFPDMGHHLLGEMGGPGAHRLDPLPLSPPSGRYLVD